MRRHQILPIALMLLVAIVPRVRAAKVGPENVKALEGWLAIVDQHTPAKEDDALDRVAALTYDQRGALNGALPLFFTALLGRANPSSNESEQRIVQIGAKASQTHGAKGFIARAAVLHGDAVVFGPGLVSAPPDPRDVNPEDGQLVVSSDGEYQGLLHSGWQAKFARDLLDRMPPRPSSDPFVAQWYHALSAYLIANRRYGEAAPDLRRAAELFPDDASILFDRACLAEAMGLPRNAQVLVDPRAQTTDGARGTGSGSGRSGAAQTSRTGPAVQFTEGSTNAEAERLFRRVLEVDPSRADARVRLGRLLIVRRRYAEADAELTRALAKSPGAKIAYLAHLFASRATARLGRFDAAATHVDSALALFPDAQSALIAKSQLALQRADEATALAPIDRLATAGIKHPIDPWMGYETGLGPEQAGALLLKVWASASR